MTELVELDRLIHSVRRQEFNSLPLTTFSGALLLAISSIALYNSCRDALRR
jgi:hypothetical protein